MTPDVLIAFVAGIILAGAVSTIVCTIATATAATQRQQLIQTVNGIARRVTALENHARTHQPTAIYHPPSIYTNHHRQPMERHR